jgi:hypothetical protein
MGRDPRTAAIPVIALGRAGAASSAAPCLKLQQPFDLDEIAKLLLQLRPAAAAR